MGDRWILCSNHRLHGFHEDGAVLWCHSATQHQHPIIIEVAAEFTRVVVTLVTAVIRQALGAPIFSHQLLDVLRGAMQRHLQQHLFIFRRCGTGHSAHFGVADRAAAEGVVDGGELLQALRNAHFFTRSAEINAAVIVEPVRWRFDAVALPCGAFDERSEQRQKAMLSGVDVSGETGNFVTERGIVCRDESERREL
ncbi:MAG: hypothetical protein Q7U82_13630 [Gammaproteobacteria bacterium]|nr:hypothetical protein [Gammaproteobacteria bacterium]